MLCHQVKELMATDEFDRDTMTFKQFNGKLEKTLGFSLAGRKAELKKLLQEAMVA